MNNSKDNKLSDLLKSNEELKNQIIQLKNELNIEKEKNKNLNIKINELQNMADKIEKKYKEEIINNKILKEKIISSQNNTINNTILMKLMKLMDDLEIKEKKLNEIKSQLKFELNEGEKIMTVIFNSLDQQILHSFICKNTDKFTKLENLLYDLKEYKEYKKIENYFLVCGKKINKYETLEENGIKNNDIITLVRMVDK